MGSKIPWTTSRRILPSGDGFSHREVVTNAHEPGIVSSRLIQHNEKQILEQNQFLRNIDGGLKDFDGLGRYVANIPEVVYMEWHEKYSELRDNTDARARTRFLLKLLRRPENRKYCVQNLPRI
jgi:hypothetical protein